MSTRPTVIDVDLDALCENYQTIRSHVAPAKVLAVLKANAYGHGLVQCARALVECGADYFGVALLEEGLALRRANISAPILVFGGIVGREIAPFIENDLELTASSIFKLDEIERTAEQIGRNATVQLKIDTGMGRIGVRPESATKLIEHAATLKHCNVKGVFSHFACADESDPSFTQQQMLKFAEATATLIKTKSSYLRHIANSGAILQFRESYLDMVRAGLILYGVAPSVQLQALLKLKPVLSLHSHVVYFKVVKKGCSVSYGRRWIAEQDTRVVTIPVGYGDGYARRLSNRGEVLIGAKRFPIAGTICMDQFMVNIGAATAYNGDEAVLIGKSGDQSITVEQLAELAETVPHEILTALNLRIPRRFWRGGKIVAEE